MDDFSGLRLDRVLPLTEVGRDDGAPPHLDAEWLEADGLGGFASGTVGGIRTRRYHALLLAATQPPAGRVVLVNGVEAWAETRAGRVPLSSQLYAPGVVYPDARPSITRFSRAPWPTWTFRLPDGTEVEHEIVVDRDAGETLLRWRRAAGEGPCRLVVRPLLSGRDYHALHQENAVFRWDATVQGGNAAWRPYADLPAIAALTNGAYRAAPEWYRRVLYAAEQDRGLDCLEDLAAPGEFTWELAKAPAVMLLRAGDGLAVRPLAHAAKLAEGERARRGSATAPISSVDAYLVDRADGTTVIAGFPWFTDWGRDTFIAMRGLLLATGRLAEAERILLAWSGLVSEGMLPNRFPDDGGAPEYNAADASLWFVVAAHDFLQVADGVAPRTVDALRGAIRAILTGYAAGTRYGIAADADGLLRAGAPGQQLTWMDAKVDGWVVTPRWGKPVEVQALWINALRIGGQWWPKWDGLARRASSTFGERFSDPATGGLLDVVDEDGVPGRVDRRVRPNQIFAVGGLPHQLVHGATARQVVAAVETRLLTPMGLRTLAPDEPGYAGRYFGDRRARDGAYHQGTVWPWLIGPFVEAWLRVRGDGAAARAEARARFLAPLRAHLGEAGLGHVSEVADGDPPHAPGGCPFQAWSLGELLRAERMVAP
jgi:predicted glycogen debranching enzyme